MVVRVFSREADMTSLAIAKAQALGAPEGYQTFLEYESTNGMPDVVFATFDERALYQRAHSPLARAFVQASEVAVLMSLDENDPAPVDLLAQRARLGTSSVSRRLRSLAEAVVLVERVGRFGWRRLGPFPGLLRAVTAIELKLRDWRKALDQAARYRSFAERSLVVVDSDRSTRARANAVAFQFNGIGLASLSACGELEQVVAAPDAPPFDEVARVVAGERLWARDSLQRRAVRSSSGRSARHQGDLLNRPEARGRDDSRRAQAHP